MRCDRVVGQCNPGVYGVDMGQAKSSDERLDENIYSFVSPMSQVVSYRLGLGDMD